MGLNRVSVVPSKPAAGAVAAARGWIGCRRLRVSTIRFPRDSTAGRVWDAQAARCWLAEYRGGRAAAAAVDAEVWQAPRAVAAGVVECEGAIRSAAEVAVEAVEAVFHSCRLRNRRNRNYSNMSAPARSALADGRSATPYTT